MARFLRALLVDNCTVTQQRILLELLLEKSTSHLNLSIVDKVNSRLQVRKSPSALWRTNLTSMRSVLHLIGISRICVTRNGRSTRVDIV